MNAPTVLLYNLDPEKARQIKLLCLPMRLRARTVSPEEFGMTLGELLRGETPAEGETPPVISEEMLVMANLSGSQMNRFLQGFRRKKIPPVALKAVLTPTNANWNAQRLRDELRLEHEAMLRGESAHEGKTYLAVDIGASSGRHILGRVEQGKIVTEEVYRFENKLEKRDGHLCWDLDLLFQEVLSGLKACKDRGTLPDTMGIDTWGVDFVLLDGEGKLLGDSVAYRDPRTQGMDALVEERISQEELYARTGIQKQSFNTIYQLMALKQEAPELLERARHFLTVPDYLHYRLTGQMANEYTEATTTGLIHAETKTWDRELLRRLGYPEGLFREPSLPGTVLGSLSPEIREQVGFDCTVVLPASHDTGSAFLAIPAKGENAAALSSGTWSLLGVELPQPILSEESREANFTNEGGYSYRFRYLKNIMGLWMIQSIRREAASVFPDFSEKPSFGELEALARKAADFPSLVDVESQRFLAPDSMTAAVREACRESGQPVPQTPGEVMACVYHSLAACYRDAVRDLGRVTGRDFTAVHIVGGGSKDTYLDQLTANATGLPVYAGPTEGTALGNLMVQMLAAGEFPDLEAAREAERKSFEIVKFTPEEETEKEGGVSK